MHLAPFIMYDIWTIVRKQTRGNGESYEFDLTQIS